MSERKDGGSAFPQMYDIRNASEQCFGSNDGMDLRDWFAGQAISAAMINVDIQECNKQGYDWKEYLAIECYAIADKLVEVRDKQ